VRTDTAKLTAAVQLFSQTKFLTSLACIQLWEKGLVDFDDAELINKHLPELVEQKVLEGFEADGSARLVDRTTPLTLRRLLTHTSGLSYSFLTPELIGRWQATNKKPGFLDKHVGVEALAEPLTFQPGTRYGYGIGIDWAGVLVMRLTGQKLGAYFDEHIFGPCGVKNISFYPTKEIKANLQQLCGRDATPERNLIHTAGFRDVPSLEPEDIGLHMGGAGLIGSPREYMTVLRHVLQCKDKDGLIKQSTFPLLFENALPPREEEGKSHTCYRDLGMINALLGDTEAQFISGDKVHHSLALCVDDADSEYGRKKGTAFWGGIAKTKFWIDPTTGVVVSLKMWTRRLC
jgi:methyl acetate hydrolase